MLQKQKIDWESLGFGIYPTRSMWKSTSNSNGQWDEGGLIPYGNIEISPAAGVLNYGQGIFEGMKAHHSSKDRVVLFRPDMNAKRISRSCKRLCMPEIPEDYFMNAPEKNNLIILSLLSEKSVNMRSLEKTQLSNQT